MTTAGIVLAAGESRRMGSPKALLRGSDGIPLAVRQAAVLRAGGCNPVAVVLGSEIERIRRELPVELTIVENPRWAQGRATSVQAGIRAFPTVNGFLFLPVDAMGVLPVTIQMILEAAAKEPATIWRPVYGGEKGNVLWIPSAVARELLRLPAAARIDEWVQPLARPLEVADSAILRNINTPADWAAVQARA